MNLVNYLIDYTLIPPYRVRLTNEETKTNNMKVAQIAQNKMLRLLDGTTLKDRRKIKDMLEKVDLPSVNQLAATIKLTETWKAMNLDNYPIKLLKNGDNDSTREVRSGTRKQLDENPRFKASKSSFSFDAARLWNQAPQSIKECKTLRKAKSEINNYCRSLPI